MVRTFGARTRAMMSRFLVSMAVGVFAVAGLVSHASAFSEPIPIKISLFKWGGNPKVGKLYKIVSKGAFPLPAVGTGPDVNGGSLLVTVGAGEVTCDLSNTANWKGLGNPAGSKGHKYVNKSAPTGDLCKVIIVKEKVIKVLAKGVGSVALPGDAGTNPDVSMELNVGLDSYCAEAIGPHFKEKAETLIKMKDQAAPASCAKCGDNSVNLPGEECDGTDDSACPGSCVPPGGGGGTCGDHARNGGAECTCAAEQCDGTEAPDCPGVCQPNCVCPLPVCGNGVREEGEACDPPCEQGACGMGEICGGFCTCVPDIPCDCGSPDPTLYKFTTKAPTQAACGSTDGDPPIDELACMGLYLGGGGGSLAVPNQMTDENTPKYNVSCCQGTDMAISPTTEAEVGVLNCTRGKTCSATSNNAGALCTRDRHCPGGFCENHCLFGAPLEVFDQLAPPISVCGFIEVPEDSMGGVNCETGEATIHYPLDARLFLSFFDGSPSTPGFQACPICYGGTLGIPGSGSCEGGPNNGQACTPQSTSYDLYDCCAGPLLIGTPCSDDSDCPGSSCVPGCTQYPTSHDCPAGPATEIEVIGITPTLTTETSSKTANEDGNFCGWCRDVEVEGSFCFEGDPDEKPSPGQKGCPDSLTIACRPATFHSDPPVGGDPADLLECNDALPCNTDADCAAPYETCTQRNPGAFRDATVRDISYEGARAGDLRTPGPHIGQAVTAFCVGPSFDPDADFSGDIGGPGGVALTIDMQLSPSGAFFDMTPGALD